MTNISSGEAWDRGAWHIRIYPWQADPWHANPHISVACHNPEGVESVYPCIRVTNRVNPITPKAWNRGASGIAEEADVAQYWCEVSIGYYIGYIGYIAISGILQRRKLGQVLGST